MSVPAIPSVYDNLLSFLVEKATPEEILAYTVPEAVATRAIELMERNNEGLLTEGEAAELEDMRRADKLISLLKARSLDLLTYP